MDNLLNNEDKKLRKSTKLLLLFIIVQPLLDFYFLFDESVKKITFFSPSTLIRIGYIFMAFILLFINTHQNNRKTWKYIFCYLAVVFGYTVVHTIANYFFAVKLPASFNFNIVDELFYIIRLLLPLLLLFLVFKSELKLKHIRWITLTLVLIIGLIMIVSNLFHVSLLSFSDDPIQNEYTFLSWFSKEKLYYKSITSKGLFYRGNQISGVLLLLFPITLMFLLKKPTLGFFIILAMQIVSMFMLGSRVCVYGMAISFVVVIGVYIADKIYHHKKIELKKMMPYAMIIIIFAAIYPFSPLQVRTKNDQDSYQRHETKTIQSEQDTLEKEIQPSKNIKQDKVALLEGELLKKYVPSMFYKNIYPIAENYSFWQNINKLPENQYDNNRKQQILITKDILERIPNNQELYVLFGMGRSRLAKAQLIIEHDFLAQFYTVGLVGLVLFFIPLIVVIGICVFILLKNFGSLFNFENVILLFAISLFLLASAYSGHLIDELFPMLLCVFYLGFLLKNIWNKKKGNSTGRQE
ncbi:O-antigen ligase family protein [Scatolibacter rhodanostii]|uniref:O-antigen ligase family protein n=1 Tax=Scatolibacter rhodanostii TaxID=2014781 RepID=UPI000C077F24|nr:O-antigen ligase family protein [Scatolibacter rhodanostii]